MEIKELEKAFEKLRKYVEKEEFKGYDPYDTLTSRIKFKSFGKWAPIIATQIQKRNLLNIRGLLGIKKDYNPKAIGLFLYAYSLLQKHDPAKDYSRQLTFLFNYLKDNSSKGFSGYCWGYNFDWASPKKYVKAFSPNVVVTAFVAKGIFQYYELTRNEEALIILKSISEFILRDLPKTENREGMCFSYTTQEADCCYNASLLAAGVLARIFFLTKNKIYKEYSLKAVDYVVAKQHSDGLWNYSLDLKTGVERKQIDFHQGYVIDSICDVIRYCEINTPKYNNAVEKGVSYYKKQQFFESGQSKWRLPKNYPVEIHNQSQGIITFNKMGKHNEYLTFAKTIAGWTIENMQDKKGFFYYRKLRFATNKISYMRWSQAWMFVALAELLTLPEQEKY
jgi:hypothetical protein